MTPEFNAWWDADDLLEENPYDIGKPICWAWEGWQAARRREWVGLTDVEKSVIRSSVPYSKFISASEYADKVQDATEATLKSKNGF